MAWILEYQPGRVLIHVIDWEFIYLLYRSAMTELSPIAIKRLRNEGNNIRKLSREILDQEVWPFALCINVIFIFNLFI